MDNILRLMKGAIKGGIITFILASIIMFITGMLYSFPFGGPLMILYFMYPLVVYVIPLGLLIGFVVTVARMFLVSNDGIEDSLAK